MPMHDLVLLLIYQVPAFAAGILVLLTIAIPAVHALFVVGRVLTGQPARINWWVMGRVLPLAIAAVAAVPLFVLARQYTADWQLTFAEIALVYLAVAVVFVPVALPLVQAYVAGAPRFGTLVYAMLAILSLPVAGALATHAVARVTQMIDVPSDPYSMGARPVAFTVDNSISTCTHAVFRTVPEGMVTEAPVPGWTLEDSYPPYFFFWADMSLKAAFLDFFEVFDCGITNLRHNPDHVLLSSFVFFYRAFVSVIVLAVLALPFGRRAG
jgi:hypothetical protein